MNNTFVNLQCMCNDDADDDWINNLNKKIITIKKMYLCFSFSNPPLEKISINRFLFYINIEYFTK